MRILRHRWNWRPVWAVIVMLGLICGGAQQASAVNQLIGDVDSFGFTLPLTSPAEAPNSAPDVTGDSVGDVDQDQNGVLNPGDYLPDLDGSGSVNVSSSDEFDNRSTAEMNSTIGAQWTDVAMETNHVVGEPDGKTFTFNFPVPTTGDPDFGIDHFVNIVAGDLDVGTLEAFIDGTTVQLQDVGNKDGLITLTNAAVDWADMTDGQVTVELNTPSEPYVAVDYLLLAPTVSEPAVLATTPDDGGSLDFGLVRVGTTATDSINIANTGGQNSTLNGTAPEPTDAAFGGPAGGQPFTLTEGASTDVDYDFSPLARGSASELLNITSDDPADTDGHDLTLTGTGVGPVFDSDIAPGQTLDFGPVNEGDMNTLSILLSNITPDDNGGDSKLTDLTITGVSITGLDAGDFQVVGTPAGSVIGKGGDLLLEVKFSAAGGLGLREAMLTVSTDEAAALGGTGSTFEYDLNAEVVPEPASLALLVLGGLAACGRRRPMV